MNKFFAASFGLFATACLCSLIGACHHVDKSTNLEPQEVIIGDDLKQMRLGQRVVLKGSPEVGPGVGLLFQTKRDLIWCRSDFYVSWPQNLIKKKIWAEGVVIEQKVNSAIFRFDLEPRDDVQFTNVRFVKIDSMRLIEEKK